MIKLNDKWLRKASDNEDDATKPVNFEVLSKKPKLTKFIK